MRGRVVKIGNSRGVRLPKALLEQAELGEEVELRAERGRIVIRAVQRPRAGWEEAALRMHERAEDRLLDKEMPTRFDQEEWEWH